LLGPANGPFSSGAARLLLNDRRSRPHPAAADELTSPNYHKIPAAQLAVDSKVEEDPVANPPFPIEP
jgi:hypothetical protein